MSKINLFLDSSALFAGIVSATGATRVLLLLAETGHITVTISEQVVAETERAVARKVPSPNTHNPPARQGWRATSWNVTRMGNPPSEGAPIAGTRRQVPSALTPFVLFFSTRPCPRWI